MPMKPFSGIASGTSGPYPAATVSPAAGTRSTSFASMAPAARGAAVPEAPSVAQASERGDGRRRDHARTSPGAVAPTVPAPSGPGHLRNARPGRLFPNRRGGPPPLRTSRDCSKTLQDRAGGFIGVRTPRPGARIQALVEQVRPQPLRGDPETCRSARPARRVEAASPPACSRGSVPQAGEEDEIRAGLAARGHRAVGRAEVVGIPAVASLGVRMQSSGEPTIDGWGHRACDRPHYGRQ